MCGGSSTGPANACRAGASQRVGRDAAVRSLDVDLSHEAAMAKLAHDADGVIETSEWAGPFCGEAVDRAAVRPREVVNDAKLCSVALLKDSLQRRADVVAEKVVECPGLRCGGGRCRRLSQQ